MSALAITVASPSARNAGEFRHIRALDGIRGIAFLLVLGHHCFSTGLPAGNWPVADRLLTWFFSFGFLGVDLFFVLSGFLITTLLLVDRSQPHYYRNFYVKRAFRILPIFLAVLFTIRVTGIASTSYVVLSLLFVANFANLFNVIAGGPFWSLAVEEQFYLLWPQLVRRLKISRLRMVLLTVIVVEPTIRCIMASGGHGYSYYTFSRCDGLAWGAWLSTETRLHRLLDSGDRARQWWQKFGAPLLISGAVLMCASVTFMSLRLGGLFTNAFTLSACPIFFTSVIAYVLTHHDSLVSKVFRMRPLRFFGDISYASYLVHSYVISSYDKMAGPLQAGATAPFLLRASTVLVVTSVVCTFSLYLFERPVMALRKNFLA